MTILTREFIEKVKSEVANEYDVKQIELVGSYRRNQAKETSDVDFLILDDSAPRGMKFLQMIVDLEETLGKDVGLMTVKGLSETPMKQKVLQSMLKDIKDYE